ncbi:MAG TPA: hypothetical protein V6D23_02030 [Candidatus Obscuribacterales bacterium]
MIEETAQHIPPAAESGWHEVCVFLHGVTFEGENGTDHRGDYEQLKTGILAAAARQGKVTDLRRCIHGEWGSRANPSGQDRELASAQTFLHLCIKAIDDRTIDGRTRIWTWLALIMLGLYLPAVGCLWAVHAWAAATCQSGLPSCPVPGQTLTTMVVLGLVYLLIFGGVYLARKAICRRVFGFARQFFVHALGDMTYYFSSEGEEAIRRTIFRTLCQDLNQLWDEDPARRISLTLFTHSGGTVVMHDFLYLLFRDFEHDGAPPGPWKPRDFIEAHRPGARPASQMSPAELAHGLSLEEIEAFEDLIRAAREGRLRIRRFYTMASPISLTILRSNDLVARIASLKGDRPFPPEQQLKLCQLGLGSDPEQPKLRWLNFWNFNDPISAPLAFLYRDSTGVIEDIHVSFRKPVPLLVHNDHWSEPEVAERIAKSW